MKPLVMIHYFLRRSTVYPYGESDNLSQTHTYAFSENIEQQCNMSRKSKFQKYIRDNNLTISILFDPRTKSTVIQLID